MLRLQWICFLLTVICSALPIQADEREIKTSDWMGSVYSEFQDTPLNQILVPGTHHSASNTLRRDLGLTPGIAGKLKNMPCLQHVALNWSVCQNRGVTAQLEDGIRFFDLRLSESNHTARISHGLYGAPYLEILEEIKVFSQAHPKEIIFVMPSLESGGVFESPEAQHNFENLYLEQTETAFKGRYIHLKDLTSETTIGDLWLRGVRVVIAQHEELSHGWLNKAAPNELKQAAEAHLSRTLILEGNGIHLTSLILTPKHSPMAFVFFYLKHPSLLFPNDTRIIKKLSKRIHKQMRTWLDEWEQVGLHPNLVNTDFYEQTGLVSKAIQINIARLAGTSPNQGNSMM